MRNLLEEKREGVEYREISREIICNTRALVYSQPEKAKRKLSPSPFALSPPRVAKGHRFMLSQIRLTPSPLCPALEHLEVI